MQQRRNQKLAYKYYEPFQIKLRIRKVVYRLDFLEETKVDPTFRDSLFKTRIIKKKKNKGVKINPF